MNEQPFTVCPGCGEPISPEEHGVIEAVEVVATPTFGSPDETVDGMRALFHPACFAETDPGYRRR